MKKRSFLGMLAAAPALPFAEKFAPSEPSAEIVNTKVWDNATAKEALNQLDGPIKSPYVESRRIDRALEIARERLEEMRFAYENNLPTQFSPAVAHHDDQAFTVIRQFKSVAGWKKLEMMQKEARKRDIIRQEQHVKELESMLSFPDKMIDRIIRHIY